MIRQAKLPRRGRHRLTLRTRKPAAAPMNREPSANGAEGYMSQKLTPEEARAMVSLLWDTGLRMPIRMGSRRPFPGL